MRKNNEKISGICKREEEALSTYVGPFRVNDIAEYFIMSFL
jgi:hypothetical protein